MNFIAYNCLQLFIIAYNYL